MATPVNNSAWLEWITALVGGKSRQTYASTFPPDRFYCLLDELPLHLLPRRAFRSLQLERERNQFLYLNPECRILNAEEIPEQFSRSGDLLSGFVRQGTIAWVPDSAYGSLMPFWLGPAFQGILQELDPNEPVLSGVPADSKAILAAAGILVSHTGLMPEREQHIKANVAFRDKGYAPLSGLIHPFHMAALRRYYRHQIRTGAIRLGDGQSDRRYAAHDEPVARFFHRQILSGISAVAGEAVKPSYVYLASYLSGAELKKHVDREQCEFSVTLCLDFSPEPSLATSWPIQLDTSRGTVTVYQALGDGLAYRGTRLPHYRSPLPEGRTSTSIFFHYVRADFAGALC